MWAEPPSQHSHPQLSAPLPGFEPTGKECLDGCASSDVRARTSRPAAEMLKGTSLLRKERKKERKTWEKTRNRYEPPSWQSLTPAHSCAAHPRPRSASGPSLGACGAHVCSPCVPSQGRTSSQGHASLPEPPAGTPRAASTNSSQAPAHLVQLPAFPMPRLSPIWPEAQFLCHPLSRTQRRTQASRGSFPSKLLPEAPPDPGTISSDPSVL